MGGPDRSFAPYLMGGPQPAPLVASEQSDGGQRAGADGRRQRGGEDEAAAVAADHVHQRGRGRDEAADVAVRLPCERGGGRGSEGEGKARSGAGGKGIDGRRRESDVRGWEKLR